MADGYSAAAWIAAHTALLTLIEDGASDSKIKLYDGSDVLLGEFVIDDATSDVSGVTGDITIEIATQEDAAIAGGTASYITICDGDGDVVYKMSCQQGTEAVAGKCVMNSLTIIQGAPIDILSCEIPAGTTYS